MCEREIPQARWPDFPGAGLEVFKPFAEVYDYLQWRFEPVTSLIAELRDVAAAATSLYLIDLKDGWLGGCDIAAIGKVADGAILCAYWMQPPAVEALMRSARSALGPDKFLGTGFRVFYPEMPDSGQLRLRSKAAVAGGANGINYYNYGLIRRHGSVGKRQRSGRFQAKPSTRLPLGGQLDSLYGQVIILVPLRQLTREAQPTKGF